MNKVIYTKEVLQEAVASSRTYRELFGRLGKKWSGGLHDYIKRRLEHFEIDTSHFMKKAENPVLAKNNSLAKKTSEEILQKRDSGKRHLSYMLRRALIEAGTPYVCSSCGITNEWNGKPLVLQVHHKNGDCLDDRRENLEFQCPNCHSQTDGWCNSKGLTEVTTKRLHAVKQRGK